MIFHLASELKVLLENVTANIKSSRKEEARIRDGFLKYKDQELQTMHVEDLAALETISEDLIVQELEERHNSKNHYTFVGDVLLFINPNTHLNLYGTKYHFKYKFKSRSDNAPHIFAVADSAYQDMMHHEEAQHIVLAGEILAGKTTSMRHLLKHLVFLGQGAAKVGEKIEKCLNVIHAIGNAGTPINANSTRHVMYMQITFGSSGKLSGSIFWLYQLEKWRVTGNRDPLQANFHIFYYFYDAMEAAGELDKYFLEPGRKYRYLRAEQTDDKIPKGPRETPEDNVTKFQEIYQNLNDIEFDEIQMEMFSNVLAAILLIGEIQFESSAENTAELSNPEVAANVGKLLTVDEKKFQWSLCNYCVVKSGTAERRRHTKEEAEEAREVLARTLYVRLADWIVNVINLKLSLIRAIFGDKHCVGILDMYGFECYQKNEMEQLFVNTLNEQLQYSYNQKVFVWEMQEQEEEEVPITPLQYYDNKPTIDELLNKPDGLMYIIDDATRSKEDGVEYIIQTLTNSPKGPRIKMSNSKDFCVAHYTGKVTYETRMIPRKNRDFLPPEMIETLRSSHNGIVKQLFSNQLTRSGNLTLTSDQNVLAATGKKKRWGAALVGTDSHKLRKYNTESRGEFSQTRRMRTASSVFRASSLEILKAISGGGTKFVRCIRADLSGTPGGWQSDVVKQQIRALGVVDTARARQKGYSCRVSFADFIHRYRFLAFDFDEPVDVTKENCRLLLIRLKMEGWMIGKSKVFLRYYNEEYLARLYETQVKKIVKVQCMMRTFLARKRVAPKLAMSRQASRDSADGPVSSDCPVVKKKKKSPNVNIGQDEAATKIQKQYRGYRVRKDYALDGKKYKTLDQKTIQFMTTWGKKWKAKSMFQVLLLYRAQRLQDLTYFCQQVHIYNQNVACVLLGDFKKSVSLDQIKPGSNVNEFLGPHKAPPICKVPFRYNDILKFDPMEPKGSAFGDDESWDEPLKRGRYQGPRDKHFAYKYRDQEVQTANLDSDEVTQSLTQLSHIKETCPEELNFIDTPYTRDPTNVRQMYSEQQYRNKYNTPKKARAPSPPRPMSRTKVPVNSYTDINQDIQNESYFRGQTPPARMPPPPPVRSSNTKRTYERSDSTESVDNSWVKTSGNNNNYNNSRDSQPVKYTPKGAPARENNPVHELQMLAKRNDNEEEGDDPPFNFQAMLRKTNTTRASLRRVRGSDNTEENGNGSRTNTPNYSNMNGNTTTYNNINRNVDTNRNKHANMNGTRNINNNYNSNNNFDNTSRNYDSNSRNYDNTSRNYDSNSRNYDSTSRNYDNASRHTSSNNAGSGRTNFSKPEFQRTNSNDLLIQSRNNLNRTNNGYGADRVIRTELAPGIIIEGVVVDL
ncbi:hypothetical protein WDU94_008823 [Cyamophila willieti]